MSGERAPSSAPSPETTPVEQPGVAEQVGADAAALEQNLQTQSPEATVDSVDDSERQDTSARGEAKVILKGSQRLDQLVLDGIGYVQQNVTEKVNTAMENTTFAAKDKYVSWRVNSTRDSLENAKQVLESTPKSGPLANKLRSGRARKVRKLERRLRGLSGLYTQINEGHRGATAQAKDENGNELGISTVRQARQQLYQRRINDMLKVEKGYYEKSQLDPAVGEAAKESGVDVSGMSYFDMVGLGRKEKRRAKNEARHPGANPARAAELRNLIRETNSVEKLEAMGRKEFLKRLAGAAIKDTAKATVNHYANRFEASLDAPKAAL